MQHTRNVSVLSLRNRSLFSCCRRSLLLRFFPLLFLSSFLHSSVFSSSLHIIGRPSVCLLFHLSLGIPKILFLPTVMPSYVEFISSWGKLQLTLLQCEWISSPLFSTPSSTSSPSSFCLLSMFLMLNLRKVSHHSRSHPGLSQCNYKACYFIPSSRPLHTTPLNQLVAGAL